MSNGGIKGDDLYMSIDDSVKKPYGGKIFQNNSTLEVVIVRDAKEG